MIKYKVIVSMDFDLLLKTIQERATYKNPWPSMEFEDGTLAEQYAMMARLATGKHVEIRKINPEENSSLRERIATLLRTEQ